MWVYHNEMPVFRWHESVPLYLQKLLCSSPIMVFGRTSLMWEKSVFHGYISAFTSGPSCFEIKSWLLDAMATDTSIWNIAVVMFPTTLLNVFLIPKPGPYNLVNTWKRQVAPLNRTVSHLLNKPETAKINTYIHTHILHIRRLSLAGVAQMVGVSSSAQKGHSFNWFLVRAHTQITGSIPGQVVCRKQLIGTFSLCLSHSLSFSPPLSLKISHSKACISGKDNAELNDRLAF